MKIKKLNGNKSILDSLFYYLILTLLPLVLSFFPLFSFFSQGTVIYTYYCYIIYIILLLCFLDKIERFHCKSILFFISLLILLFMNIFFSINHNYLPLKESLINILSFTLIFLVISSVDYCEINLSDIERFYTKIIKLIFICCILNVFINVYNEILDGSLIEQNRRYASFFPNKNTFAQLIYIGLIYTTYFIYKNNFKKKYLLLGFILFINLLLTESSNSLFSFIIFIIIFNINLIKQSIKKLMIISAIFTILIVIINIVISLNHVDYIGNLFNYGLNGRSYLWDIGWSISENNHFIGIGDRAIDVIAPYQVDQFHNMYIEILVRDGGGILIVNLLMIFYVYIGARHLCKFNILLGALYKATICSLVFYGLFESWSWFKPGYFSSIFTITFFILPILLFKNYKKYFN